MSFGNSIRNRKDDSEHVFEMMIYSLLGYDYIGVVLCGIFMRVWMLRGKNIQ